MPNLYNKQHHHNWVSTGRTGFHAGRNPVAYLKCTTCGQIGYRTPPHSVIYTWSKEDPPDKLEVNFD